MAVKTRKRSRSSAVNKSELIREILLGPGDARNRDVIATLGERKVRVSPAQVSNVRAVLIKKGELKPGRSKGKGRVRAAVGDAEISLDVLLEAKKLAQSLGGIDRARRALDALAKLS